MPGLSPDRIKAISRPAALPTTLRLAKTHPISRTLALQGQVEPVSQPEAKRRPT